MKLSATWTTHMLVAFTLLCAPPCLSFLSPSISLASNAHSNLISTPPALLGTNSFDTLKIQTRRETCKATVVGSDELPQRVAIIFKIKNFFSFILRCIYSLFDRKSALEDSSIRSLEPTNDTTAKRKFELNMTSWNKSFSLRQMFYGKKTLNLAKLVAIPMQQPSIENVKVFRPVYFSARAHSSYKQPIHEWYHSKPRARDFLEAIIIAFGFEKFVEYTVPCPSPRRMAYYDKSTI